MDFLEIFDSDDNRIRLWARVRAYTSLASVVWIRTMARIDNKYLSPGFSLFKANDKPLIRVAKILIEIKGAFEANSEAQYARIKLWTLFTGAYEEQAGQASGEGRVSERWFNVKLVEQANTLQLVEWDAVREILLGFLYTDVLQPHGFTWFGVNGEVGEIR